MTSHSMENLAFHSLLRWKVIILQILATSLIWGGTPIYSIYRDVPEITALSLRQGSKIYIVCLEQGQAFVMDIHGKNF